METRTFEFQIDGRVTLEQFFLMTAAWKLLFETVGKLVGESDVLDTEIESLQYGSAMVATQTSFRTKYAADQFTEYVNESARHSGGFPASPLPQELRTSVRRLRAVAKKCEPNDGFIIRTKTEDFFIRFDAPVSMTSGVPAIGSHSSESFGVLSGRLESISSRQGFKAVIYDEIFDRAVRLNLDDSWSDRMRVLWSKQIHALGTIRRDFQTGRPLSISEIQSITEVVDNKDQWLWKEAKGVLRRLAPGVQSEDLINRSSNG